MRTLRLAMVAVAEAGAWLMTGNVTNATDAAGIAISVIVQALPVMIVMVAIVMVFQTVLSMLDVERKRGRWGLPVAIVVGDFALIFAGILPTWTEVMAVILALMASIVPMVGTGDDYESPYHHDPVHYDEPPPTRCAYCGGIVHVLRTIRIEIPGQDSAIMGTCPWCYAPADKAFPEGIRGSMSAGDIAELMNTQLIRKVLR